MKREYSLRKALEQTLEDVRITYRDMIQERQYVLAPIVTALTPITIPVALWSNFISRRYMDDDSQE